MSDSMDEPFLDHYSDPSSSSSSSSSPIESTRPPRQGLPPAYRMRHDAHFVDELDSRRRAPDPPSPALAFPTSIPVTFALRDMTQDLEGVASCFNLVAAKARPLRERMGLALARVGVHRSMRAFQAMRVLLEDSAPELRQASLNGIIENTLKSLDEELRLTESRVSVNLHDTPIRLKADPRMLSLAVQTCVGTLVSLVEASTEDGLVHITTRVVDGLATCELRQDAYRLAADQFARLTDLEWSDRPGGIPAGIGLAAAARIAQAHGGTLEARRTEAGGCSLKLVLPIRD
jgi:hypothetical protein